MKTVQTLQQQSASSQYVYTKGQDVAGGEVKPKGPVTYAPHIERFT